MTITIDALYLLLLGEFSLILLVSTIYLFLRNKKHKKLYQKTLKEFTDMKSSAKTEMFESPRVEEPQQERPKQEQPAPEPFAEPVPVSEEGEAVDEGSLAGKINKLQHIINFQKGKIIDLMCYKDILEGGHKKLNAVQDSYQNLKERFVKLLGETPENKGLADALEAFESNNNELNSYVEILEKENETLAEKFRAWEDELKRVWEQAERSEGIDEGRYQEIMNEKEELVTTLKEFEGKLEDKTKLLDEMQNRYEDLEKEYMVLYRQQQQQ